MLQERHLKLIEECVAVLIDPAEAKGLFGVESRKKTLGELVRIKNLTLNLASLRLDLDVNSHGDCRLTDLELSGAPQCRTGEAGPRALIASARATG